MGGADREVIRNQIKMGFSVVLKPRLVSCRVLNGFQQWGGVVSCAF